ncbi:hypothetical protein DFJ73DRAFT_912688 [Zopfochytrium polystomum]|nr:hypothetical protein DFJ73DRAFT_912688 [Zopfochytrium polystomum]
MDPTPPPAHNVGHSETRSRWERKRPLPPDDAVVISPGATAFYAPQVHVPPARDSVDTESLIGLSREGGDHGDGDFDLFEKSASLPSSMVARQVPQKQSVPDTSIFAPTTCAGRYHPETSRLLRPHANEPAPAGISVDKNRTRSDAAQCCPSSAFLWLQQDCVTVGGDRCTFTCICVGSTQPANPLNASAWCDTCSHVDGMEWCGHYSNSRWELYQRIDNGSGAGASIAQQSGVTIAGPQRTTTIAGLTPSSVSIESASTPLSPGLTSPSPSPSPSGTGTSLNAAVIGAVIGAITLVLVGLGIAYAMVQRRRHRDSDMGLHEKSASFPAGGGAGRWTQLVGNSVPPQPAPPIALVAPAARFPPTSERVLTPEAAAIRPPLAIPPPQSVTPSAGIPSPPALDPTPPPADIVSRSETPSRRSASDLRLRDDAVVISPSASAFYSPEIHVPPNRDSVDTESSLTGFMPRGGSLVSRVGTTATATSTVSRKFVGYEDTAS